MFCFWAPGQLCLPTEILSFRLMQVRHLVARGSRLSQEDATLEPLHRGGWRLVLWFQHEQIHFDNSVHTCQELAGVLFKGAVTTICGSHWCDRLTLIQHPNICQSQLVTICLVCGVGCSQFSTSSGDWGLWDEKPKESSFGVASRSPAWGTPLHSTKHQEFNVDSIWFEVCAQLTRHNTPQTPHHTHNVSSAQCSSDIIQTSAGTQP